MQKKTSQIKISSSQVDAVKLRFDKYFRFNNSPYWKAYYLPKIKTKDIAREQLYSKIIRNFCGEQAKVVDIGSGYGFLAKELVTVNLDVTCVDLFPEMLEEAKKRLKGLPATFINTDILDLPFKKNSLDCIIMESVIEHFAHREVTEDIIPYLYQFIKPGGYLFIHVPVRSPHSIIARIIRKYFLNDLPKWAIDDDGDVTHKMWLSYREYITLFEKHGFTHINYDFRLTRSNARPKLLYVWMKEIQKILSNSNEDLSIDVAQQPYITTVKKMIKSKLALTSYILFKKG